MKTPQTTHQMTATVRLATLAWQSLTRIPGTDDGLDAEFLAENWPCRSDLAREELLKIVESRLYTGQPLPVFTMDGSRVIPADQEAKLKGALVDVHVAITHQSIKVHELCSLQCMPWLTAPRDPARTTSTPISAQSRSSKGPVMAPLYRRRLSAECAYRSTSARLRGKRPPDILRTGELSHVLCYLALALYDTPFSSCGQCLVTMQWPTASALVEYTDEGNPKFFISDCELTIIDPQRTGVWWCRIRARGRS
jgi:hypothetical protein